MSLMFLFDHGTFSVNNRKLINPNNERKPFFINPLRTGGGVGVG